MPLVDTKLDMRAAVRASGLEWSFVETGMFVEALFDAWIGFDWNNGKVLIRYSGWQQLQEAVVSQSAVEEMKLWRIS